MEVMTSIFLLAQAPPGRDNTVTAQTVLTLKLLTIKLKTFYLGEY